MILYLFASFLTIWEQQILARANGIQKKSGDNYAIFQRWIIIIKQR